MALALLGDSRPRYLWLPLHHPAQPATAAATSIGAQARMPRAEHFQRSVSDADKAGEVRLRLQWTPEEAPGEGAAADALAMEVTLAGMGLSLVEASGTRLPREARSVCTRTHFTASDRWATRSTCTLCPCMHACGVLRLLLVVPHSSIRAQVAHLSLEGVRGEVRRSSGGSLAARVTVAGLQVDNQLVTSSRPVVLCASQQVPLFNASRCDRARDSI